MLNNIKSYGEKINEAAAPLPKMPEFLRKLGAKEEKPRGGPAQSNPVANHWEIEITNKLGTTFSKYETFRVDFYPTGDWEANVFPNFKINNANKLKFGGKYKESPSAKSNLFGKEIPGVELISTSVGVPKIQTLD